MAIVGIGLGSNLGKKLANLRSARNLLVELMPFKAKHFQAPLFQSAPVDCPESSPDFYNTAIEIVFEGTPESLLHQTQQIEKKLGRPEKVVMNEPRIIDLDILYFDDVILQSEALELPHPRIQERRFVLEPLIEICPERILPNQTLTILELFENLCSDEPPLTRLQSNW